MYKDFSLEPYFQKELVEARVPPSGVDKETSYMMGMFTATKINELSPHTSTQIIHQHILLSKKKKAKCKVMCA